MPASNQLEGGWPGKGIIGHLVLGKSGGDAPMPLATAS